MARATHTSKDKTRPIPTSWLLPLLQCRKGVSYVATA